MPNVCQRTVVVCQPTCYRKRFHPLHSLCYTVHAHSTQFPSTFTQFNSMEHHNSPVQSSNLTQTSQRFLLKPNLFFFFTFFSSLKTQNLTSTFFIRWLVIDFFSLHIISFNGLTFEKTGFIFSKKKQGSKYEYYSKKRAVPLKNTIKNVNISET